MTLFFLAWDVVSQIQGSYIYYSHYFQPLAQNNHHKIRSPTSFLIKNLFEEDLCLSLLELRGLLEKNVS